MKSLFLGLALILLLGVAGFFYRNVMESTGTPEPIACTMEAKICPDGSAVGRSGPSCAFAPCAFPNAEDPALGIAFVVPEGYAANADALGADETLRAVFEKTSPTEGVPHALVVRVYPIPAGETAEDVIISETLFETADMGAESMDQFEQVTIGGREFFSVVVERFEAQVHSLYYLPRTNDVLRFEVLERDVVEWMEPTLDVEELPEHSALIELLETLVVGE